MQQDRYNPYVFGPPVQDPAFFFGREHELTIMLNTIVHTAPGLRQSMAVVGPRRIGKSSLLYQLIRQLQTHSNVTALLSTQQFDVPSRLMLTQEILHSLRESAREKNLDTAQVHFDLLDSPTPSEELVYQIFRRDLRRLNDALAANRHSPAVLMIDEVEGLVEFGGLRILGVFRDLAQSLPYVLFVVAGSDGLYQLITDSTSPFFNVFKTITIKPLAEEDARAMIREPAQRAGIQFEDRAVEEVLQLSGGIPYLINMICHYATETVLTKHLPAVTQTEIEIARRHILQHEHGYFLYIWQQAQGMEKVILYALAVADEPLCLGDLASDVAKIVDFTQPIVQVRDLLTELVQRQTLREDGEGHYSFSDQLFPVWLQQNRMTAQVAEESLPPIPDISNNPDAERLLLEERLKTFQDNLAFLEEQIRSSGSSNRQQDMIRLIKRRIERTILRIDSLINNREPMDTPTSDVFSFYETGIHQLLSQLEPTHPRYQDALVYQQRLLENIAIARKYGDTETRRAERAAILDQLNYVSLSTIGTSFNALPATKTAITSSEQDVLSQEQDTLSQEQQIHLKQLLDIHRRRLRLLEMQQAKFGLHVPSHLLIEIEDIREEIANLKRQMEQLK
jgi:AAA+ ATPase superfamily predicted ATPase